MDKSILRQRIIFRRLIQVMIIAGIFLMAITNINYENDIYWQLKMGEEIWETHHFPTRDHYNLTNPGAVWTLEEWVPGVIFYILNKHWGPAALILLKAAVVSLTFSLFFLLFNRLKVNLYLSFAVLLLAAMVNSRYSWGVFPSIFEYLFIVLTLLTLEYCRKITWKTVLALGAFSWVWANSHASFFLLTFMLISYAIGSFAAEKIKRRFPGYEPAGLVLDRASQIKLAIAAVISAVTPFATPNGYWTFIYPFRISFGKFSSYVSEYQRYWQRWNWDFGDFVHGFTFILIVIILLLFLFSIKKLNPIDLLLAVIFTGLALMAVRHVAIFALAALYLIAKYIKVWFGEYRGVFRRTLLKDILLVLFVISFIYFYKTNIAVFGLKHLEDGYPKEAAEFINANKISGNMFNHYNYGGYLIWKMPDYKVFIDGRLEMYLGQVGREYMTILDGADGYEEILDKYKINFALTYTTDPIVGKLIEDDNWRIVHYDQGFAVFIKNSPQNSGLIAKYGTQEKHDQFRAAYREFMAEELNNLGLVQIKKRDLAVGAGYFYQAVSYNPNFIVARLNLAGAYMELGWWNEAKDEYTEILKQDPQNEVAKANSERAKKLKELADAKMLP